MADFGNASRDSNLHTMLTQIGSIIVAFGAHSKTAVGVNHTSSTGFVFRTIEHNETTLQLPGRQSIRKHDFSLDWIDFSPAARRHENQGAEQSDKGPFLRHGSAEVCCAVKA